MFDEQGLRVELGSIARATIERAIAGLDGVIGVDLGQRGREIAQKGTLRAPSKNQLYDRIGGIADYMDGYAYTLVANDGRTFENVRIDVFKLDNERTDGRGLAVDYQIIYTQLMAN